MREIVLDTETTGLDPFEGHRIIEIGAIELFNRIPTGEVYHQYINPQRDVPIEAVNVHGLTESFLADKPVFEAIADDFLTFVGDAALVIHNAGFDMKFLNAELEWAKRQQLKNNQVIDTLQMARRKHPGSPASLDALCQRYNINNAHRELHGALLDCELLAEVYIDLLGMREPGLSFDLGAAKKSAAVSEVSAVVAPQKRPSPLPSRLSEEELAAHQAFLSNLGSEPLWTKT